MVESIAAERLLPCLLDRITDQNPESQKESRVSRVISLPRYRESVLRDLRWLFNARSHLSEEDIELFPEVARSVANFGMQDFCGKISSSLDIGEVERQLVRAIEIFEPRIIPNTLSVRIIEEAHGSGPNVIAAEIHGELWATPFPEQLYIKTEIDLETGQCAVGV